MYTSVSADCKLILYADDSAIPFVHKDLEVISQQLSEVMESCSNWQVDGKVSLHLGKTECVLLGPRRNLKHITNFNVKCKEQVIKSQDSVRYLGLYIDKKKLKGRLAKFKGWGMVGVGYGRCMVW